MFKGQAPQALTFYKGFSSALNPRILQNQCPDNPKHEALALASSSSGLEFRA